MHIGVGGSVDSHLCRNLPQVVTACHWSVIENYFSNQTEEVQFDRIFPPLLLFKEHIKILAVIPQPDQKPLIKYVLRVFRIILIMSKSIYKCLY